VESDLGWAGREPGVRVWLVRKGLLQADQRKPLRPKDAVEGALRVARKRRSSSIYRQLAEKVSFSRCEDPAFVKLETVLRSWFAAEQE